MVTLGVKKRRLNLLAFGAIPVYKSCRRNREVYAKITHELVDAGYTRSFEQCRDKMKKVRGEYKKIKD